MKWTQPRLALVCGLVPTLLAAVLSLTRPITLTHVEYDVYDTLVRAATPRPPSQHVVVVDVDEKSLSAIGQWPWRRDVIGTLIARLREMGAAAIAVDVIFPESDRDANGAHSPDSQLADTLRQGGAVLGYAMRFDDGAAAAAPCVQHPLGLAVVTPPGHDGHPLFQATGAMCSLPLLNEAAGRSGFLNAAPDADGILRRVPVLMEVGGEIYPSLAIATVASVAKDENALLRVVNANASALEIGGQTIPLDGRGNLLLRYRGEKRTFPYLSAADVMHGRVGRSAVAGKLVFLGTTALGTREVVATPLDTLFAGVEVQATVADNLLQGDFAGRPVHAVAMETEIVIAFGLLAAVLVRRVGPTWGALGVMSGLVLLWLGAAQALSAYGTFLSPLYPTLGVGGTLAAMTIASVTFERRRADNAGEARAASQRLMVQSLLSLTGIRDLETGRHSSRTERYARVLAEQLARNPHYTAYLSPERIELLASLAPLHDIGKVGVPDAVLNKPSELTPEELAEMRRHPEYGRDVILKAEREAGVHDDVILSLAKEIVYTHHEKWDGTGYPQGLRGPDIPIPGRVMALVDVWDAIRTRRLYDQPMSTADAKAFIVKRRGTHFDPAVVDAFEQVADQMDELSAIAS
jgi:CHASE2 domain-containing sensor protein